MTTESTWLEILTLIDDIDAQPNANLAYAGVRLERARAALHEVADAMGVYVNGERA